jgi:homoserine kinase
MPEPVGGPLTASVPATSANLGPGYDALGLALDLRDEVTAEIWDGPTEITVVGEGADSVPRDSDHLVHRAMSRTFAEMGRDVPAVRLHCRNAIPHGRGLGSSSAAIVAGVGLARALGSLPMDDDQLFALAARIEGHPDNVAPACYGGFTVAYADGDGRFRAIGAPVDPRVRAVALVPPDAVETRVARAMLPAQVDFADAALNAGRAALLVAALGSRPELLLDATEDRLHQRHRAPAMPDSDRLVTELRAEGLPAVISGAGPTVLVLTETAGQDRAAARAPQGWVAHRLAVEPDGLKITAGSRE